MPVIVELADQAEPHAPSRLVRRLVRLELGEMTLSPPVDPAAADAPLYFRVLPNADGSLRVELWQVGSHYGSRSVSSEGGGQLTARRIALASAELARRLERQRRAELARAKREAAEAATVGETEGERQIAGDTTFAAVARGALVGPTDLWLVGPEIRGGLRLSSGPRLEIGAAGLAGRVLASGAGAARWLELSVAPGFVASLSPSVEVDVGLDVAAAAVHLTDVDRVDDEPGQTDTWSARTALSARFGFDVGSGWRFVAGPEVGVVLRPVQGLTEDDEKLRLGGLWTGLSVGMLLHAPRSGPTR